MQRAEHLTEKARQFAKALDACNYRAAAGYLSPNCRYHVGRDDCRIGPESILASYRESTEKARREFDEVEYDSEAESSDSSGVALMFFDKLRKGVETHVYRCSQVVCFDDEEKIARIELHEIAGERERLNEFRRLHAIISRISRSRDLFLHTMPATVHIQIYTIICRLKVSQNLETIAVRASNIAATAERCYAHN